MDRTSARLRQCYGMKSLANFLTLFVLKCSGALLIGTLLIVTTTVNVVANPLKGYVVPLSSPITNEGKFGTGIESSPFGSIEQIENQQDLASTNELNVSEVDIESSSGSTVHIFQQSDDWGTNWAEVTVDGNGNYVLVSQDGSQNQAYLAQSGDDNTALLLQKGVNNTALLLQDGNENFVFVTQKNMKGRHHSKVSVSQLGNGHSAVILAGPKANVGIEQAGSAPKAIIMDVSSSMAVDVTSY
ncbi:hypothetical protein [Vibrio maritimus]|uniref:hypothetical protein n=1 Tax=Vibrio maritimus TaxID=990268 RepID=UPI001F26BBF8|nr:hypothetical protein [Vibrio maritimus]